MAETLYVTDVLQLALHEREGSEGKLIRNLPSGTALSVLERKGLFARVRTEDGAQGWTKVGFLVEEKPARLKLAELEARNSALEAELDATKNKINTVGTAVSELREKAEKSTAEFRTQKKALVEDSERKSKEIESLQAEIRDYRQRLGLTEYNVPIRWVLIGGGIVLVLGFIGGLAWFDYRSRKRHGGFRIY